MEIINMWAWQDTCSGFNGWDEQWNTVVKVNFIFCVKVFVTSFKIFYFLYFLFSHNLMIMFFNWNSSNVFFCHFQLSVFNFYLVIHELHIFIWQNIVFPLVIVQALVYLSNNHHPPSSFWIHELSFSYSSCFWICTHRQQVHKL